MKNEPAFPIITPDMPVQGSPGLTKLEYFAGLALQGLLATPGVSDAEACAEVAVEHAKSLIAELEKEQ